MIADAFLLTAMFRGRMASFERVSQADAEGIFLVGELVNEVAGVAPDRKPRVGRGGVEGGARAVLVVVKQIS